MLRTSSSAAPISRRLPVDGKLVGVGDELTYTIDWVNNAVDKSGTPAAANVTVTDKIPHGTEFVSASDGGKHENGAVTWKFNNQPAGASGTVALTVRVTDDAVLTGSIENQALHPDRRQQGGHQRHRDVRSRQVRDDDPDEVKPGETVLTYQISSTTPTAPTRRRRSSTSSVRVWSTR